MEKESDGNHTRYAFNSSLPSFPRTGDQTSVCPDPSMDYPYDLGYPTSGHWAVFNISNPELLESMDAPHVLGQMNVAPAITRHSSLF
jgi:hypothetical protein